MNGKGGDEHGKGERKGKLGQKCKCEVTAENLLLIHYISIYLLFVELFN